MCGIFGIWSPAGVDPKQVERLSAMMGHRGPDASGLYVDSQAGIAFAHRRLKILDLSDDANQPMRSPDGRFTLIYNGEIVNYRAVLAAYQGPWVFRTESDSEVLLATFAEQDIRAAQQWVGMFAFAIHDAKERKLYLLRDRFGIKPLYIADLPGGGLAFSSEIPPLLEMLPARRADENTILTFLERGEYDCGQHSFFADIKALEPGCALTIDLASGARKETRWYSLAAHLSDLSAASFEELVEAGATLVEQAITDHLIADVPVGLNVSGGVDSSVLVGVAKRHLPKLHVFSQDYPDPYSEASWVRKVADGVHLHLCRLNREAIEADLEATIARQAEPFGGTLVIGYDALYRAARDEGITVLLDGNGVDECFLGYTRYLKAANGDGGAVGAAIDGTSPVATSAIAEGLRQRASLHTPSRHGAEFSDPLRALAARDLLVTKIPRGLRFNDRMSMGRSRELRVPFLDHRLVEFAFSVPIAHHLRGGETKALFRSIAEKWIPHEVAHAPKRSVQSPQREWLGEDWSPLVLDILNAPSFAARGWVDPVRARSLYDEYRAGKNENSFFLWQWINLELWARAFLD